MAQHSSTNEPPAPFQPFPLFCETISTGSTGVDTALGIGGVPRGWITEIYGPESAGKTTVILGILAAAQREGGVCALIDADYAIDPGYAQRCGIDPRNLYICQPGGAEEALAICAALLRSGCFSAIAIDSATALLPQEERVLAYGRSYANIQKQVLNSALPSLAWLARKTGTALLITNQLRTRPASVYQEEPASTAALALKLHAALRLELRGIKYLLEEGQITGQRVQIKVVKNKFANSATTTQVDILYNEGIDRSGEILDLAVNLSICHRGGEGYFYGDLELGESRQLAKKFLAQHDSIAREIETAVRRQIFPGDLIFEEH